MTGEAPTPKATARSKARPDPRPSRMLVGAGALAALSVMGGGLASQPIADGGDPAVAAAPRARGRHAHLRVERRVRYVRLKPGQHAPPGARVIQEAAPAPRVIVRHVASPAYVTVRRPTVRTRQSGGG
jgi:hypothetical protein